MSRSRTSSCAMSSTVMESAYWHRYQVLTKRPERVAELDDELPWPPQIWLGVSVESDRYLHRIDLLREWRGSNQIPVAGAAARPVAQPEP